jgi:hypothetical protein
MLTDRRDLGPLEGGGDRRRPAVPGEEQPGIRVVAGPGDVLPGEELLGPVAAMVFSNAYFPALFLPPSAFKELSASRNLMV